MSKKPDDAEAEAEAVRVKLFLAISQAVHGHDLDEVIPILITASARALVDDAGGNREKLAIQFARFSMMVKDQIREMAEEDERLARESTRQ